MDRITKSLLEEFTTQNGHEKLAEDKAFEHFTGYIVTSRHFTESFQTDDIHSGAGGDSGFDSLSIIVNGCLVTEPVEIEDLSETNGYLDVTFIFNQAERSSGFDTSKVGQFGFGVIDFFQEKPTQVQNSTVKKKARIVNEIFSRSSKFKKGNPSCYLYYTTTGRWVDDTNLKARKTNVINDLLATSLFRKVDFEFVDAEKIQKYFRETKNAITAEITFSDRIVLPELPGIEQAYIGLLPATEYLKLIENENGEIITSIFYDNVRHWQEWNSVNKEIKGTLDSTTQSIYFPLLNNGITIIARRINPTGNRFMIEDYQVVNGCQTSFVIHESREHLNNGILIPVRIISTENAEVKNSIIKATNRQTEVTEEQLFALSDFPKKLEAFFPAFEGSKKLYYERRSRQYNSEEGVEKVRVINMTTLVRSFASLFLALPHRTTRNYKALLKQVGSEIFNKEHRLEMYYVSAFAQYKLEYYFRSGAISTELKAARYHILLLFRLITMGDNMPKDNSIDMKKYCEALMTILWNEDECKNVFLHASEIIKTVADGNLDSDHIRTEPFTEKVKAAMVRK